MMEIIVLMLLVAGATAGDTGGRPPVIKEHPGSVVARRNDPATLNCAASGAARIQWFREGREVATSPLDSRSHRVLLPSGSLFFLRVIASKKDADAGTYWCVASNSHGETRSRNATLTVASLAYDFQRQAGPSVRIRVGDPLVLPCRPPRGTPTPEVHWLREGHLVSNASRVSVSDEGDLVFSRTVEGDAATYVCRARNAAGVRESSPTHLTVMTPPWFEERPSNVTSASGVVVELACRARGSPAPTVTWRRLDGKMPLGRATIQEEKLVLDGVVAGDSGTYVCEVENEAGVAAARASLTVVDAPQLTQRSQDLQVMAGQATQVMCRVEGQPPPTVLWRLPTVDRAALLSPGQTSGHATVSADGRTLLLQQASAEDSGTYHCWAVSSGGGVSGRAEVLVVSGHPPPVMGVGPRDLTLTRGSQASFPCEAVSEGAEADLAWWHRPSPSHPPRRLSQGAAHPRLSLPANGALIIKDVRDEDAGIYTCHVTAASGTVQQQAVLRVSKDAPRQPASQPLLPAPPSKPRLVAVNETAVQLSWMPNSQVSGDSNQWYKVEYWREGWEEWRVAHAVVTSERCVVTRLTPGQTYTFLVRAVSSRGASFPSPWSDPVTTRPPPDPSLTLEQLRHIRRRLSRPVLTLTSAAVSAPDSVQLVWDFLAPTEESVEGVLVYAVDDLGAVQVATVLGTSSSTHLLDDLRPNTPYMFFVVPFWHSVEGTPSNSRSLTTPEDVPEAAPGDVRLSQRRDGSVLIQWSAVGEREARGRLVGYQVTLNHNGSHTTQTVTTPWLESRGLLPGQLYTVRVAALTAAGTGPLSDPVLLDVGRAGAHGFPDADGDANGGEEEEEGGGSLLYAPPQPAWLVYLLIPLVVLLCLATLLYVGRLRHKAPPSNPPHAPALYQDPSIYPDHPSVNMYSEHKLWRPTDSDKDSSLSSTRLLPADQTANEYAEPRLQRTSQVTTEPYATTALLSDDPLRQRQDARWPHQGTDDSGVHVNWVAFLPPPPACPPPLDLDQGDPASSSGPLQAPRGVHSATSQYDNMAGSSERYERPCGNDTQHTYEAYTQVVTPLDGVLTFNTLQTRGSRRVRAHCSSARPPEPERSNTQ
ncbi:roundabout homolog 2-like [Panulirus ornatus]|uniref:roundabout homolog 2-like n=1 Tax=Panulirus ornatus TaxID=150431 RepID=UPI003A89F0D2